MRQFALCLMFICAWLAAYTASVTAIVSQDLSSTSNRITVSYSAPVSYKVRLLPENRGFSLIAAGVNEIAAQPNYPRLSQVLDAISAHCDGQTATIDVTTMGRFSFTHHANDNRDKITVILNVPPKPLQQPTVPSKTAIQPRPQVKQTQLPQLKPPTIPETPAVATVESLTTTPAQRESVRALPQPVSGEPWRAKVRLWLQALGAGVLVFLAGLLIGGSFRKPEASAPPVPKPEAKEQPLLLLDTETRRRMVQRLSDQGWSTAEIAKEMKITVQDVERILALPPASGPDRDA